MQQFRCKFSLGVLLELTAPGLNEPCCLLIELLDLERPLLPARNRSLATATLDQAPDVVVCRELALPESIPRSIRGKDPFTLRRSQGESASTF